ncbi:MAG: fumarylacetoacetate hydrolase family protein [Pseudomonadales bacterium]
MRTIAGALCAIVLTGWAHAGEVERFVRFATDTGARYGQVLGDQVQPLSAAPWLDGRAAGAPVALAGLELLAPAEPSKVIAVGFNYISHRGEREPDPYPGLFAKFPTSISGPTADIVYPADATVLHYEGEMVVVIGRTARAVPQAQAAQYVFGVMAGDDVSERAWQRDDLQWLRAKASDGFGPIGPMVVRGIDYGDLLLETRVNGEVKQSQRTSDLIFDVPYIVSYVSRYVTLLPGDLIFTGTPGATSAIEPGDLVEVTLEGVGSIRNRVVAAPR